MSVFFHKQRMIKIINIILIVLFFIITINFPFFGYATSESGDRENVKVFIVESNFKYALKNVKSLSKDAHEIISAGHMAFSIDNGKTLYGLSPDKKIKDDPRMFEKLLDGAVVTGKLFDDTKAIVEIMKNHPEIHVYSRLYEVNKDVFNRIKKDVDRRDKKEFNYAFPSTKGFCLENKVINCIQYLPFRGINLGTDAGGWVCKFIKFVEASDDWILTEETSE
ncbi:MAG: hypothetical protein HQK49_01760 [Oligoflexia bacterium]|nr:hypothetical protein [Oligoflexia bacterium]